MRRYFVVSFEMPAGATAAAARDYVWDAVGTMKGCLQPYDPHNEDESERGDPMAELDGDSVRVTLRRRDMLTDKELNEIEARLAKSLPEWESRFVMLGGPSTAFVVQLLANAVTLLAEVRRLRPVRGPRGDEDE